MFLFDLDSALKSILRAAEIDRLFGDIESLFFDLNLMAEIFIEQGHLKSVEATLAEFLQRSNPPQSRVEEFLADVLSMLLSPSGEWRQAQAYYRQQLDKLHLRYS